jgi:hypothetical protein
VSVELAYGSRRDRELSLLLGLTGLMKLIQNTQFDFQKDHAAKLLPR